MHPVIRACGLSPMFSARYRRPIKKLKMIANLDLTKVLVLDIETVSGHRSFGDLSPEMQELWRIKSAGLQRRVTEDERAKNEEFNYFQALSMYYDGK